MTLTRDGSQSFLITPALRSYKHQYSNIYFIRLGQLRQAVEDRAKARWRDVTGTPVLVPRVLDVEKSQLCYIIGTVYMDMPLKPNVLEDLGRDHSIPVPPLKEKFYSNDDGVMLEDESGRIRLVGQPMAKANLVTGVILAALGAETANGEFEVIDLCYAGMAPHAEGSAIDGFISTSEEWIGLVSGLDIGAKSESDTHLQLLAEYLATEVGVAGAQEKASRITRLVIAGNSLAPLGGIGNLESIDEENDKKPRRYGYDTTSFSPRPIHNLSDHLGDIASSIPVHILPGPNDPSGTILPQQPFPRAMFGAASSGPTFHCETNPTYLNVAFSATTDLEGRGPSRSILVNSGQPLDDMFKYVATPPTTRLSLAESTLHWRHMAPTAPDTLWCHPYFTDDPFVITNTPDIYAVGNQPRFSTKMVADSQGGQCRIVLIPSFADTGVLVLINLSNLAVELVRCGVRPSVGTPIKQEML